MAATSSTKLLPYAGAGFAFRSFDQIGCSTTKSVFSNHVVSYQSDVFTNTCLKEKKWRCELLQNQQNQKYGAGFVCASQIVEKALNVKMVGFGKKPKFNHLGAVCQRLIELAQEGEATKITLYVSPQCFSYREWKKNGFRARNTNTGSTSMDFLVLNLAKHALTPLKYFAQQHKKAIVMQETQTYGEVFEGKLHAIPIKKEYIQQIRKGRKVVEGRLNKPPFSKIAAGDHIKFHYYRPTDNILCRVKGINRYSDFRGLLEGEGVAQVLPEVASLEEGVAQYQAISSYAQTVGKTGALAIQIEYVGNVQNKKRKRSLGTEQESINDSPATKKQRIKVYVKYPLNAPLEMTLGWEFIDQMLSGQKTKEGRIFGGAFSRLSAGDHIRFFSKSNSAHDVICTVTKVESFWSFREMLEAGGVESYLPLHKNTAIDGAVARYHSIDGYQRRAEKNGVVGLTIKALGNSETVYKSLGGMHGVWTS